MNPKNVSPKKAGAGASRDEEWVPSRTGEAGGFTITFVIEHLVIHGGGDAGEEVLSTPEGGPSTPAVEPSTPGGMPSMPGG